MNITFFIGNGFDLNLGLKTKYSDFYPFFIQNSSENNMIRNWLNGNEKLWSDLEEKLGQELEKLGKDDLEQFYIDKEELDRLLIDYLEKEQEKYTFEEKEKIKSEFKRSMLEFAKELPSKNVDSINATLTAYRAEEYSYSFVTFNYTNILDKIMDLFKDNRVVGTHQGNGTAKYNRLGEIVHIHGTTDEEMILGVNDASQILNNELKIDALFLNTFIKPRMNEAIGQKKIEKAKQMINSSHIICIFGMSLGNTDKMWWEEIIKWLVASDNNKLIIFWKGHNEELRKKLPATIIRLNEHIRRNLFEKGKGGRYGEKEYNRIKEKIMILYNSKIFSLPKAEEFVSFDLTSIFGDMPIIE